MDRPNSAFLFVIACLGQAVGSTAVIASVHGGIGCIGSARLRNPFSAAYPKSQFLYLHKAWPPADFLSGYGHHRD